MIDFFAPSTYWKTEEHAPFTMFSWVHISVIVLMAAAIALIIVFRKRIKTRQVKLFLIASAGVWFALEVFKITLFFTTSGNTHQALGEVLPLYMCSLYLYTLPLAAFGRGVIRKAGEYTLATLCLLSGLLTTINCPMLHSYPPLSFYSLHSLIYHAAMAATGVLLIATGYIKLELKKFYYPMFLIAILAVPAIIMNNAVDTDYMLMHYALGTPVLVNIAEAIGQVPQIFLMLFIYTLISVLMTLLAAGVNKLISKDAEKSQI